MQDSTNPDWLAKGERLRKNRVSRKESLGEAARRMGITPRLLGDIEHGRADPMAMLFPAEALSAMAERAKR